VFVLRSRRVAIKDVTRPVSVREASVYIEFYFFLLRGAAILTHSRSAICLCHHYCVRGMPDREETEETVAKRARRTEDIREEMVVVPEEEPIIL
jgi:hypothetical protein